MRVEPYAVGSYTHVIKRGARGLEIVRDNADKYRFVRTLYYLNDHHIGQWWERDTYGKGMFYRPDAWPAHDPLVDILAYTLMPNHFHLLLREVKEGGMSQFMKKLGQSLTNHTNEKYHEQGSMFQGSYRSKTIESDEYLRYVAAYIMVKNTFELYPNGGLTAAQQNFAAVWEWAVQYQFSSIGDYAGVRTHSPILKKGLLGDVFTPETFRSFARDVILAGKWKQQLKELE